MTLARSIHACAAAKAVVPALLGLVVLASSAFATSSVISISDCGAGTRPIQITVKTGDVDGAGTDSNITLAVVGTDPKTLQPHDLEIAGQKMDPFKLNQMLTGNAFERNATDVMVVCVVTDLAQQMENIWKITLTSDGKFAGSKWFPDWVQIKWFSPDPAKAGDRIFQCPVAQWLDAGSITVNCQLARIDWHPAEIIGFGGKCLDVNGAGTDNGTVVQMWDCHGGANQQWTFSGGQIVGLAGKCLDVKGAGTDNGTAVQMWDCVGVPNQQWNFINAKIFGFGGKCLDVRGAGTANGTAVQMWDCATVANQNWSWH